MGEAGEDRLVQEQPRVEALDEPILVWLARRNVVPFHIALLGPAQDRHAGEFCPIVADNRVGPRHPIKDRCIELPPDPGAGDRCVGDQSDALSVA